MWVLRRMGYRQLQLPPNIWGMATNLTPHVIAAEPYKQSGEWKRHKVYAQGLKLFPDAPRDDVALALELAVKRMKGKATWR